MANPISRTAYYTLGVRAADAASAKPLCGDTFASRFMNDEARRVWEEFKGFTPANRSNAARHAMIDDQLRPALASDPDATVVIIGAGFDTRAFRVNGGQWFEFDEPEILGYKERTLPAATAPNPLVRVPVDFGHDSLADKLSIVGQPTTVHIVVEGVLMYLTHDQKIQLIEALRVRFPRHTLYCDLMRKSFFDTYGRPIHQHILGMGTTFTDMVEDPERMFLDAGYTMVSRASVTLDAVTRQTTVFPAFIVRWFMPTVREGYSIVVFRR